MNINNLYEIKLKKIDNGPGYWSYTEVSIFNKSTINNTIIAKYNRTYDAMFDTFFPFEKGGKHYALISMNYTNTSVISLDTGKIIAEEPEEDSGFCPVGFYVPRYFKEPNEDYNIYEGFGLWDEKDIKEMGLTDKDIHYTEFGFVSGCHWGDDSTWKLQWLDLSEIEKGIIKREEKFGYFELPPNQPLWDAISCEYYDENMITLNTFQRFSMDENNNFKFYSNGEWVDGERYNLR